MSQGKRRRERESLVASLQHEPDFKHRLNTLERRIEDRITAARGITVGRNETDRLEKRKAANHTLFLFADLTEDDYEWCFSQLAELLRREAKRSMNRKQWVSVLKSHRFLFITALVGTSNFVQNTSRFWPLFWQQVESPEIPDLTSAIRDETSSLLDSMHLFNFADREFGKEYVSRFVLHAGFPASNLHEVVDAVQSALAKDLNAEESATAAKTLIENDEASSTYLKNFIAASEDVALEIFGRTAEVVEAFNSDSAIFESFESGQTNGLPHLMFTRLKEVLTEEGNALAPASTSSPRQQQGRITWDEDSGCVTLELPVSYYGNNADWLISVDGKAHPVSGRKADRCADEGIALGFAIPYPWQTISVSRADAELEWSLPTFSKETQALFFDKNGALLKNQGHSSGSEVYVAAPAGTRVLGIERSGRLRTLAALSVAEMTNWPGWMVRKFSTKGLFEIQLEFPHGETQSLGVGRFNQIKWAPGKPIKELVGTNLLPVYSTSPEIEFPPSQEGDEWRLSIYYLTNREAPLLCIAYEFEGSEQPFVETVFPDEEDAWIGTYKVSVYRNGLFQEQRTFNMAEGVHADGHYKTHNTAFKYPSANLTEDSYNVWLTNSSGKSITLPNGHISDKTHNQRHPLRIEGEGGYCLDTLLNSTRLEFQLPMHSGSGWNHAHMKVQSTDLDSEGKLRLRVPAPIDDLMLHVIQKKHQKTVASLVPARVRRNVYECDLPRLLDNLEDSEEYLIALSWAWPLPKDARWNEKPTLAHSVLLTLQLLPLFQEATVDGDTLTIKTSSDIDDNVLVWAWPLWGLPSDVREIPMRGLTGTLPAELVGCGPLVIDAKLDAFFSDVSMPVRPTRNSLLIRSAADETELSVEADNSAASIEYFLSQRIAQLEVPENVDSNSDLPLQTGLELYQHWTNVSAAHADAPEVNDLMASLADLIQENSRDALDALEFANLQDSERPAILIGSRLVNQSFHTENTNDDYGTIAWLDILDELNDYSTLIKADRAGAQEQEEKDETHEFLIHEGGTTLVDALAHGSAEATSLYAHDGQTLTEFLDLAPIDARSKHTALTTQVLVSQTSRQKALLQLLANKETFSGMHFIKSMKRIADANEHFMQSTELLRIAAGLKDLPQQLSKTMPESNWMWVPYISFVFSTLSRLYAADQIGGPFLTETFPKYFSDWSRIAVHVPELTVFDIVVAEAVALHTRSVAWEQARV